MGIDIENFEEIVDENFKDIVDVKDVTGNGIPLVADKDTKNKNGYQKKGKYKKKTWDEDVKERLEKFAILEIQGKLNSTLTICNIPNYYHFSNLIRVLKHKYPGRATEFLIADIGTGQFHHIYKESGLEEITNAVRMILDGFSSDRLKYDTKLGFSVMDETKNKDRCVLHIDDSTKSMIDDLLLDMGSDASKFGLVCCVLTFHKAKELFKDKNSKEYLIYYGDDGYYKSIVEEVDNAGIAGIKWVHDMIPKIMQELIAKMLAVKYEPDRINQDEREFLEIKIRKCITSIGETIRVINNRMERDDKYNMLYIIMDLDNFRKIILEKKEIYLNA